MIKFRLFILIGLFVISMKAQLLNEIGFFVGGANYNGDIGNEMYIEPNTFAGGLIYRRNVNSRITLRGTLSMYPIKDDDKNSFNEFRQQRGISFTNTISEVAIGLEFNFWDYDITNDRYSYTPYLIFEAAGFHYQVVDDIINNEYNYTSSIGYAIPLGIGFKSKIVRNFGYAAELRARYTLTDDIDYNNELIPELNIGNPKTNDWYFFTGVSLTYSFGRPPCAVAPRY